MKTLSVLVLGLTFVSTSAFAQGPRSLVGPEKVQTWTAAKAFCDESSQLGPQWRLPTKEEFGIAIYGMDLENREYVQIEVPDDQIGTAMWFEGSEEENQALKDKASVIGTAMNASDDLSLELDDVEEITIEEILNTLAQERAELLANKTLARSPKGKKQLASINASEAFFKDGIVPVCVRDDLVPQRN